MSKARNKTNRQRAQAHSVPVRPKKLLAMALGAILVSAPGLAMAQDTGAYYNYGTNALDAPAAGTNPAGPATTAADTNVGGTSVSLPDAITTVNTGVAGVAANTINADLTATAAQTITGTMVLDGSYVAGGPATGGLRDVRLWSGSSASNGRVALTFNSSTTLNNRGILRIENATGAGDGIIVENMEFLKGLYDEVGVTAGGSGLGQGGGGLFIGYVGASAAAEGQQFQHVDIVNAIFDGNEVNITLPATIGYHSTSGGGFLISNNTYRGDDANTGTVELATVTAKNNSVLIDGTDVTGGDPISAFGGGGRIVAAQTIKIENSTFDNNTVTLIEGSHARGGGLAVEHETISGAGGDSAYYDKLHLTNNMVKLSGAGGNIRGLADGGGYYALFENEGGANTTITHTFANSDISGNQAVAADANTSNVSARGGGAIFFGQYLASTFDYTSITGNTADATGGGNSTYAFGGGIATSGFDTARAGLLTIQNESVLEGNKALASDAFVAIGQDLALGGGIYARGNTDITNSSLLNNQAVGAEAYGGAMYVDLASQAVVYDSPGGLNGNIDVDLGATSGHKTIIKGNTVTDAQGTKYSGLYFGSSYYGEYNSGTPNSGFDYLSTATGVLTVNGGGQVWMIDPLTVDLHGVDAADDDDSAGVSTFSMAITNTGGIRDETKKEYINGYTQGLTEFVWGGENTINVYYTGAGDRASIAMNDGTDFGGLMRLTADYSLKVESDDTIAAGNKTALSIDLSGEAANKSIVMFNPGDWRAKTGALVDFTDANKTAVQNQITINKNTVITAADQRALYRVKDTYELFAGLDNVHDMTGIFNPDGSLKDEYKVILGEGVTDIYFDGTAKIIYAEVDFEGTYTSMIDAAGKNTVSSIYALDLAVDDWYLWSDEALDDLIADRFRTVTPEYALDQAMASTRITGSMGDWARKLGLQDPWRRGYNNMPDPCPEGFRLWSGYVGMFNSGDSHGGYRGYDVDTNGFLIGGNWEFEKGAVGIYGGFSKSDTEMDGIKSKVETDGVQFGIQARLTPLENLPNLAFYGDVGYASYDNDGWRDVSGHREKGSFDQDAWTVGLGVNYVMNFESFALTPFLNLRYVGLDQDGFTEKGWLTATRVNGVDVDSFTSVLGAEIRTQFCFDGGYFAPYASAGWRHEYGDDQADAKAVLVNPGGSGIAAPFKLSSLEADTDSADLGLGFDVMFDIGSGGQQLGVNVSYEANIGSDSDTQTFYGGLQYRF